MITFPTKLISGVVLNSIDDAIECLDDLVARFMSTPFEMSEEDEKVHAELNTIIRDYKFEQEQDLIADRFAYRLVGIYDLYLNKIVSSRTFDKVVKECSQHTRRSMQYIYNKIVAHHDRIFVKEHK